MHGLRRCGRDKPTGSTDFPRSYCLWPSAGILHILFLNPFAFSSSKFISSCWFLRTARCATAFSSSVFVGSVHAIDSHPGTVSITRAFSRIMRGRPKFKKRNEPVLATFFFFSLRNKTAFGRKQKMLGTDANAHSSYRRS